MKLLIVALCTFALVQSLSTTSRRSVRLAKRWPKVVREEQLRELRRKVPNAPVRMAMGVPLERLMRAQPNFTSTTHGTPLKGKFENQGLWYVSLLIGTPPREYTVQADTGSSDLGIAKIGCTSCGHPAHGLWDPSASSSAKLVPCDTNLIKCTGNGFGTCKNGQCAYEISYEDNSGYSAEIWQDVVNFAGVNVNGTFVGGISKESNGGGSFEPHAVDGIIGLAFQSTSVVLAPTITDILSKNDPSCPNVFSMCGNLDVGGAMTICGIGNHHSNPIEWTPMIDVSSGFYNIHTVDMSVNGTRLNLNERVYNSGSSSVDSGTTGVYLPTPVMKKIFEIMSRDYNLVGIAGQSYGNSILGGGCYKLSPSDLAAYPNVEVIAGKESPITIVLTPESYILPGFCNEAGMYSSNIIDGGAEGSGCLFGDSLMLSNQVIYDKDVQRMGFSLKANCNWQ